MDSTERSTRRSVALCRARTPGAVSRGRFAGRGASLMTSGLVAALASALTVGPVQAAPNNNNSEKLRDAVTVEGVRRHQAALQQIATTNGGNRFAGPPGTTTPPRMSPTSFEAPATR